MLNFGGDKERVFNEGTFVADQSDGSSIIDDSSLSLLLEVLKSGEFSEAPLVGDDDFLSSGEFVFGSSEGFKGLFDVSFSDSD